ncbi:MAG: amino acid ABC transporter permease [Candidatus Melainabacteria bacterium]|nr:amino acid ABC transporter permease [Candidatus Melainabacteria bacterium]
MSSAMPHLLLEALPMLLQGLGVTLGLALSALLGGLLLGIPLGIARHEGPRWLRLPVSLYVESIRSVPLILFLVFIHYGLLPLLGYRPNFMVSSLLAFILFEAAYLAEIIRGGLRAIRPTERDAAKSLGLSWRQQMQYVCLPLAVRRTLPTLVGQGISLLKDTSLASIVGVIELTRAGEIIYEQTFQDFEILCLQGLIYFLLCYGLSQACKRWENNTFQQENTLLQSSQA